MKNPALPIRVGVIAALKTVLPDTPIRDTEAGPNDQLPYVLLSTQTMTDDSPKTNFQVQSTLLIQVVDKKSLTVNRGVVDNITNIILQMLIPQNGNDYITVTGFKVCHVTLDSLNDTVIQETDGVSTRKLIRLRFTLYETDIT